MANLKDLKNRIDSVKSTKQITQAMQMVAAAKLKKAEEAAENARPYAERMEQVLANLARSAKDSETAPKLLRGTGSDQTHLLIVATAERGLCGGFNASIAKLARQRTDELQQDGKNVRILTIGRKGRDVLRRNYADLFVGHFDMSDVKRTAFKDAQEVADDVLKRFHEGEFDVATIFFGRYENTMSQIPTALQLIPAEVPEDEDGDEEQVFYEYEPDEDEILRELLPRNVAVQIFRALLENDASEQGARMTAMDSATRNAEDMIEDLEKEYNRTRQAAITTELIEIISGAEALEA